MQLNENFSVLELIEAVSLTENSDEAILGLLSQIVLGIEQWPTEAIARFLNELADGISLADPYRAGLVAWACGCLAEVGHSTPRSRDAILQWAESVIQQAFLLRDRVCETLPNGTLSSVKEFDRRREELRSAMPLEYRAWDALTKCYAATTTTFVQYPELRIRARHLYERARELSRHHPTAKHIANLLLVPHQEPFLILEPAQGRGVVATVDGIESMFQFLAVITQTFADHFDPNLNLSPTHREVALGSPPKLLRPPDTEPFQTNWTAFHWSAVRQDGTLPVINEDPWEEIVGSHRVFAEDNPWDPKPFAGYRVLLLQPTGVDIYTLWSRNYPQLRPSIQVTEVLGPDAVQEWTKRFSWVNRLNRRGADLIEGQDLLWQVRSGITKELSDKWYVGFIARAIRRLVPVARQHWSPLPYELLEQLLRVLNALEAFAFSDEPFDGEELEPLTMAALDRAIKADRSRLVSPFVAFFTEAVNAWTRKVSHPDVPAAFDAITLDCVQKAWREVVMLARLGGHDPDHNLMKRTLLADRALLTELSARGDCPYNDDRRLTLGDLWLGQRPDWWPLLPEYPTHGLDYEVVLSFAGEERDHARQLATALIRRGCRVFFDESERSELIGRELTPLLRSVFRDRSLYCVAFVSLAYATRPWTQLEWAAATERAAADHQEYILPVRLDDTQLPGLPASVGYFDLRIVPPDDFHRLVADRIKARIAKQLVI